MTTVARPTSRNEGHWYRRDGTACYEVPKADGSGTRRTTIADARKLSLLPSVTTILSVLNKPELNNWLTEQAVLAVMTAPRKQGEDDQQFVHRVLHTERQQDQEAQLARDRGIAIHDAMEAYFQGREIAPELKEWVLPVAKAISDGWELVATEKIVVGEGYAGRIDSILKQQSVWKVIDFKNCKKIPEKGSWPEARLQLAAYANAFESQMAFRKDVAVYVSPVVTENVYISTQQPNTFKVFQNPPWENDYDVFANLRKVWCWLNNYWP